MNTEVGSKEKHILVVDDEESVRRYLATLLTSEGYEVSCVEGGMEAINLIKQQVSPSAVILDVMMPQVDGLETLRRIREIDETLPIIMLSAVGQTATIVKAMKMGASDYLTKPFEDDELGITLEKVFEKMTLVREVEDLRDQLNKTSDFISINDEMIRIKEIIRKIAGTDATVLVLGESGVGKELIARAIHDQSLRRDKVMVRVNCAALPSELLESELFGFERGAFTGAIRGKMGKFELANGGTMFLDEIAEMSPGLQAKLLHVLQDGEFSKLGGKKDLKVDVRIVAATNQNLEKAIKEGRFREDLYYRLNVVKIVVPPLRERKEDIPLLCQHFFKKFRAQYDSDMEKIPETIIEAFMSYAWPGNIRELENMMRRLVVLKDEKYVLKEMTLPSELKPEPEKTAAASEPLSLKEISKRKTVEVERDAIFNALVENNWNKKRAAETLNISYRALQYKIKEYGIDR
ncbi:MAG: sigma-54-dependent Fis family transcriptional regulator [Candidatus Manganitrophaceae bacterium]|nr:MAG: sigma-54-dependent Fis family transcriptional regulator [Candidatus Manganitrophaceae bacterium]